jgi:transposase
MCARFLRERNLWKLLTINLTQEQKFSLEQTFKTTRDRRQRTRCQAVLMAARGRPRGSSAQDLATTPRSVLRWLRAFVVGGLPALLPRWSPGPCPRIPAQLGPEVVHWVKGGPAGCELNRANWTYAELADHLYKTKGIRVKETAMRQFCHRHGIRPYRPTYRFLRGDPQKQMQARADLRDLKKEAQAGGCVLLSQDEARFPMVPTLATTLGVKGFRPMVGTWDCKDLVYTFGAVNLVNGRLTTRLIESTTAERRKKSQSKTRRMQQCFAQHLRDAARAYPATRCRKVVLTIDNAPWHRGQVVQQVLDDNPHLQLYRLPSYSPQLNVIERLWKKLRRRATHNRLFETVAELKHALRGSLCYFQTLRHHVLSMIEASVKSSASNRTNIPAL